MRLADQIQSFVDEEGLDRVLRAVGVCTERHAQELDSDTTQVFTGPGSEAEKYSEIASYLFEKTEGTEI